MIEVKVNRDLKGRLDGYSVSGHACYDKWGRDIVCAAVSAVAQSALIGLAEYAEANPEYKIIEAEGFLNCKIYPDKLEAPVLLKAQAILECMVLGLKSIQAEYKDYVVVKEVTQ